MVASWLYIASLTVLLQVESRGQTVVGAAAKENATQRTVEPVAAEPPSSETAESVAPIVWARLSKDYLDNRVARAVDRKKPYRDCILGTTIRGESHTVGQTRLVLQPNDDQAAGHVEFVGTIRARVTGRNGPARFRFLSDSTYRARKPLVIDDQGLTALPAVAHAKTTLTPTSVSSSLPGLRGLLVRRIATRREANSRSRANAIASDHTADDIRGDLDRKVNESMAAIQADLEAQLAKLNPNSGTGPLRIRSRSTNENIEIAIYDAGQQIDDLEFPSFPSEGNRDLAVRLHRNVFARAIFDSELRENVFARLVPSGTSTLLTAVAETPPRQPTLDVSNWAMDGEWLVYESSARDTSDSIQRVAGDVSPNQPTRK